MLDRLGLVLLVGIPYALGYWAVRGGARLFASSALGLHGHAWSLFLLPFLACAVAEVCTELWERTPGGLGTGTLVLILPMLLLGIVAGVAHLVLSGAAPLPEIHSPREAPGVLTAWVGTAFALSGVGLALWRFWPEPTARLW